MGLPSAFPSAFPSSLPIGWWNKWGLSASSCLTLPLLLHLAEQPHAQEAGSGGGRAQRKHLRTQQDAMRDGEARDVHASRR